MDGGDVAFKVEALEKENKRLAEEKDEADKRWKKLEEELQELKESQGDSGGWLKEESGKSEEVEKLVCHIESLLAFAVIPRFRQIPNRPRRKQN